MNTCVWWCWGWDNWLKQCLLPFSYCNLITWNLILLSVLHPLTSFRSSWTILRGLLSGSLISPGRPCAARGARPQTPWESGRLKREVDDIPVTGTVGGVEPRLIGVSLTHICPQSRRAVAGLSAPLSSSLLCANAPLSYWLWFIVKCWYLVGWTFSPCLAT